MASTTTSSLPSGSSNEVTPALSTFKDTSSSSAASDATKLSELLADIPMSNPGEALNFKLPPTAPKRKAVSQAPGDMVDPLTLEQDATQDLLHFAKRCKTVTTSATSFSGSPSLGSGTLEGSKDWPIDLSGEDGAMSPASTSTAPLAQGSPLSCSTPVVTSTFTRSQAKILFGSTATQASVFSSLTSLTTAFNAKYSYACWTVILTRLLSKEGSSMLAGLASCFAPITTSTTVSTQPSSDASSEEDDTTFSDDEESIPLYGSDSERSGSDSEYQRYGTRTIKRGQLRHAQRRLILSPPTTDDESDPDFDQR